MIKMHVWNVFDIFRKRKNSKCLHGILMLVGMDPVLFISGGSRTSTKSTSGRFGKFSISSVVTISMMIFVFCSTWVYTKLKPIANEHCVTECERLFVVFFFLLLLLLLLIRFFTSVWIHAYTCKRIHKWIINERQSYNTI